MIDVSLTIQMVVLLAFVAFVAGYVDAIAGGGGMFQTLGLLMVGIPPVATLATNKIASIAGTAIAVAKYSRGGVINWRVALACLLPCIIAAAIGSKCVMYLSAKTITTLIILCIPLAFAVMFLKQNKVCGSGKIARKQAIIYLSPIAFYDGLLGPGTGTYMAITANKALGMSFLQATGLAKPLNLSTNIGSALVYIFAGKVIWAAAIPMAIASMAGGYMGSHSAIKRGDNFIQKIMLVMLVLMLLVNMVKLFSKF